MTDKEQKLDQEEQVEDVVYEEDNPEVTLGGKKKKDKDELQVLKDERQEYLDGWQRARAELVNLKKQHEEERKLFTTLGKQSLLEEIIPILDNFDAAFANKAAWEETPETWRVGIEYIHKQFLEVLESNGVKRFGQEGDEFNSDLYEPVEMVEGDEGQKGKVISVIQKGYKIGEKLIRPAKVKVGE